jgi:hypothetical protein
MKTRIIFSNCTAILLSIVAINASSFLVGCGDNLFSSLAKRDNKDKGKSAFQSGDYDGAISYLNGYLASNPNDTEARSMLATAYMKKVGLDELSIASSISNSSSGGDWSSIVSLMPGGTAENVVSLKAARDVISAIPEQNRSPEQNYQLAIVSAALAVTVVKESLCDASGAYTPTDEKIAAISAEDANLILESMTLTASAASATGSTNTGLTKLADVNTQIDAMDGSDNLTKIQNFLVSKR